MKLLKNKIVIIVILSAGALILVCGVKYVLFLRKAHSTFENYYAFRGCVMLIERTRDYGLCRTNTGQTIKIVKFQDRWYLDGDLPVCITQVCF